MKKIIIIAILLLTTATGALALTPTPTATVSGTPEENAEQLRDLVKQKARELIDQTKLGQKKAYVGQITKINDLLLDLETRNGNKQVQVASDTAMLITGKGKTDITKVKVNDYAIAMGYVGENEILDTRRLVLFTKPKEIVRKVVFGKIVDISNEEEKILTVKNDKQITTYTIEVTDKTTLSKKIENKMQKVSFSQIKEEDLIVVIGLISTSDNKIITAQIVQVIPSSNPPTPTKKPASPTPTISPTL